MSLLVYGRLGQPSHLSSQSTDLAASPAHLVPGRVSLQVLLPFPKVAAPLCFYSYPEFPFHCDFWWKRATEDHFSVHPRDKPVEFRQPLQRERAYPEEIKTVSLQRGTFHLRKAQTSCFTIS